MNEAASSKVTVKKTKVMSCAECRRLKLKCDRVFPCSSCVKRGLTALCPHVTLPTRPRKHPTENSQSTNVSISAMEGRIRELEDALRSMNSTRTAQRHPLLPDPSTTVPSPLPSPSNAGPATRSDSSGEDDKEFLDVSLGTLTVDTESGKSSFFGQSAGMESLYHNDLKDELPSAVCNGPFDPIKDHVLYPFHSNVSGQAIIQYLEAQLPDPARAWALCDSYYNHAAWMYSFIPRSQFEEEILLAVYTPAFPSLSISHTDIAVMFTVFAIGSLLDLSNNASAASEKSHSTPPSGWTADEDAAPRSINSVEAEHFYKLARAAMSAGPSIIEEPTMSGVRSIFLMAFYHMVLDKNDTPQNVWSLASLGVGLAVSIGLHRDSGPWKLDASVVEQRRALFWELYFFISMQVWLSYGRPPQITLAFVDCEADVDPDQRPTAASELEYGSRCRMQRVASTILSEIRDLVLSTTNVKYRDVLALDRKLRDSSVHLYGGEVGDRNIGPENIRGTSRAATMQKFYWLGQKDSLVMYLHRKYFVRACLSRSEDLTKSKYCPSFLAAFCSAQVIISLMGSLLVLEPELPRRFWFCWDHTLASAIIVGSVVIRHPSSILAADAMKALESVLEQLKQWSRGGAQGDRPNKALRLVTQLHERARWVLALPDAACTSSTNSSELSVLGGHARVFPARPAPSSAPSSDNITPSTDVHSALMEDMQAMMQAQNSSYPSPVPSPTSDRLPEQPAYMTPPPSMFGESTAGFFSAAGVGEAPVDSMLHDGFYEDTYERNGYDGYSDTSWQSFVAGLGLSGNVYR